MTVNYDLRPAADTDYDFLLRLTMTTMRDYVTAIWGWDEEWQTRRFHDNFDAANWRIISVGGRDTGGFQARLRASDEDLFLANLYLLPEFQSRGIGSAVVRALIAEAVVLGVPLTLNVLKSNPNAQRLYERLGMRVVDENEERYFLSTEHEP